MVRILIDTGQQTQLVGMLVSYAVLGASLCFIGAIFGAASKENSEMKLLAIAVAAPALITTWAGGVHAGKQASTPTLTSIVLPISTAQASELQNNAGPALSEFWKGALLPFGYGKADRQYRVIVGSFKDQTAAASMAQSINRIDPDLKAAVGERKPQTDFFPVVLGGRLTYPEAKSLQTTLSEKHNINDVFLAPYNF